MSERVKTRIAGTGSFAPDKVLTNEELSKMVDTTDAWIVERTGIRERRIVEDGVLPSDLGAEAARRAMEAAEVKPEAVDLIVCATSFPDRFLPSTACYIQAKAGCVNTRSISSGERGLSPNGSSQRRGRVISIGLEDMAQFPVWALPLTRFGTRGSRAASPLPACFAANASAALWMRSAADSAWARLLAFSATAFPALSMPPTSAEALLPAIASRFASAVVTRPVMAFR